MDPFAIAALMLAGAAAVALVLGLLSAFQSHEDWAAFYFFLTVVFVNLSGVMFFVWLVRWGVLQFTGGG